ncbi:MAG: DegV family protein [Erysipelothrix sp.]|nr:DegV family protein [Erysipelothrix sp.]
MKVVLAADSALDLDDFLYEKYKIHLMPVTITFGEESYQDTIDITSNDIYERVKQGADIPKTAATNIVEYYEFFKQFENDNVIFLSMGSGFTSAYQNAVIASKEFENIHVIDTKNLSNGMGLLAIMVDTLEYVAKGGRVSALTKVSAEALKIHPSIAIVDNELKVGRLFRGRRDKAAMKYVKEEMKKLDSYDPTLFFVASSTVGDELVNEIVKYIESLNYFKEIKITNIGSTVSVHTGPGAVGLIGLLK